MSGLPVPARKNLAVTPPRAYAASGGQGQVAAFSVSASATYINLQLGISQGATNLAVSGGSPLTPTRNYLTVYADTADLGVIFGATAAAVSGGNAPAIATVGTLSAGAYTPGAGTCFLIPKGTSQRFLLMAGVDLFLGVVGSGAGTCRLYQSSPDDA